MIITHPIFKYFWGPSRVCFLFRSTGLSSDSDPNFHRVFPLFSSLSIERWIVKYLDSLVGTGWVDDELWRMWSSPRQLCKYFLDLFQLRSNCSWKNYFIILPVIFSTVKWSLLHLWFLNGFIGTSVQYTECLFENSNQEIDIFETNICLSFNLDPKSFSPRANCSWSSKYYPKNVEKRISVLQAMRNRVMEE